MDGAGDTNEGAGRPRSDPLEPRTAPSADTIKRRETRAQRDRQRKARLFAEREDRLRKEAAVLAVAATGASLSEIASQVGLSRSRVHQIYQGAMARIEGENVVEYRKGARHSLGVLKQAAWRIALAPAAEADARTRVAAMREVRHIQDQLNRLEGAYPPAQVDVAGEVLVRREVSVREVTSIVARIQAARVLAGESDLVVPSRNGHAAELPPAHGNGSAA